MTQSGLPHSEILGSELIVSSPKLIADYHVLLRYYISRHPLCALKKAFMLNQSNF